MIAIYGTAVTVNPLSSVPTCASALVTTTFQSPTVTPVNAIVHVIEVPDPTDTELAVIVVEPPVLVSVTPDPENPVPVIVTSVYVRSLYPAFGAIPVTVGAAAVMRYTMALLSVNENEPFRIKLPCPALYGKFMFSICPGNSVPFNVSVFVAVMLDRNKSFS